MDRMLCDGRQVVFIEYQDGRPFNVITMTDDGPNYGISHYDFEWSRTHKGLYYHLSGMTGRKERRISISRYAYPSPPPAQLWVAPDITLTDDGAWGERNGKYRRLRGPRILTPAQVLAFGYTVIPEPLGGNPFDDAIGGATYYCKVCDDQLPDTDWEQCCHVKWCDGCSDRVYVRLGRGQRIERGDIACPHVVWCGECRERGVREDHAGCQKVRRMRLPAAKEVVNAS